MSQFMGSGRLLRLAWRRDRVMILVSLLVVWLLTYYSAVATADLYATTADLVAANEAANSSAGVVAIYGHIHDTSSVGGIAANKVAMLNFLVLVFLVVAVVRRHTRAEEESGRFELLGAAPVGRLAPLGAAIVLAALASVVAGLGTIAAAIAGSWPVVGSVALGLALVGVGLSFTAISAITMQLSGNTRACSTWTMALLGLAFVLRMVGDVYWNRPAAALSWLSPLGWGQQVRYYDGDRFWVLALPLLFFVAGAVVAGLLHSRRDLAAGLLPDRPGPAGSTIGSPLALAWRLQRGTVVAWLVAYALLGLLMGSIVSQVGGMLTGQAAELLQKLGGVGALTRLYLSLVGAMAALGTAAFGISVVMRARSEESSGRAEVVLATPVRRVSQLGSHVLVALAGAVVLQAVLGVALALAHARTGEAGSFWQDFSPALVPLPAIWIMVGLALVAVGVLPRLDWLAWAAFGLVVVLGELGALMNLPTWVLEVSPFAHLPKLPVESMRWAPWWGEVVVAVVLVVAGLLAYRRRDLPVT